MYNTRRDGEEALDEPSGKIVITGVSGLIGFHLADHLCRTDPARLVVGIARSRNGNVQDLLRRPNFRFAAIDLVETSPGDEVLAGASTLYHLAAESAIFKAHRDPVAGLRANVQTTLRVSLSAARVGVSKVVYTSGGAVYESSDHAREDAVGQPRTFYGASKLAAESYMRVVDATTGLRHTILRLARVYGPRMVRGAIYDLIHDFQMRRPANMYAHPDSVFDFVYVQDVVSALELSASGAWDGVTANISTGRGTRLRDLHTAFAAIFGYSVPLHPCESPRQVDVLVNDRARSLGWEPRVSLDQGLSETLAYFLPDRFCRSKSVSDMLRATGLAGTAE